MEESKAKTAYTITASDHKTKAVIIPERGGWVSSIVLPFQSGVRWLKPGETEEAIYEIDCNTHNTLR